MGTLCTGTNKDGTPCGAWAKKGSDPPRCVRHAQGAQNRGAPKGNKNAEKHGVYSRDDEPSEPDDLSGVLVRLKRRLSQLDRYIDDHFHDLEPTDYARLTALQGQLSSRVGRLERDIKATQGNAGAGQSKVERIMEEALSRFWAEMEEKSGT